MGACQGPPLVLATAVRVVARVRLQRRRHGAGRAKVGQRAARAPTRPPSTAGGNARGRQVRVVAEVSLGHGKENDEHQETRNDLPEKEHGEKH